MASHLVEIERRALQAKNKGRLREAAELYAAIVTESPGWEHGMALYNLAGCYEDLNELPSAEKYYRTALAYEPTNPIFVGGIAAFLHLHGDPIEAFNLHLSLLNLQRRNGDQAGAQSTVKAIHGLAKRIGLSEANLAAE